MNRHSVNHQLWPTYLLLYYFQVQKQLATNSWAGSLSNWGGKILNFLIMPGGFWKLRSQLTWKGLQPQHYAATCVKDWIATRQWWQFCGQILTTWRQLSHYPSKMSRDLRTTGSKGFSAHNTIHTPISTVDKSHLILTSTLGQNRSPTVQDLPNRADIERSTKSP